MSNEMTSRERVLACMERKPIDKLPCDYHAMWQVNDALKKHYGVTEYYDLLHCLGADIVDIRGTVDPKWIADFPQKWQLEDGSWRNYLGFTTRVMETSNGMIEEHTTGVFNDAEEVEEIEDFRFPTTDWFDYSNLYEDLQPYKDFAIMASGPSVFQHPSFLRGIENLLCDFAINPDMAHFIIGKFCDYYMDHMSRMFESTKGMISIMRIADDMGTQIAPLFSLDNAREFIFPYITKLCDMAHSYGVKVMMHSCGSIRSFIPDVIKCGVDMLDPLQPRAKNMELGSIRDEFADQICLHGSVDTQVTLPRGTTEDVRAEVMQRMSLFAGNTGFIIAPAHVLQPDVPVENIVTMYETIKYFNENCYNK